MGRTLSETEHLHIEEIREGDEVRCEVCGRVGAYSAEGADGLTHGVDGRWIVCAGDCLWVPTPEQLRALKAESHEAGDDAQVSICRRAIAGDAEALRECARVIDQARAMEDE